MPSRVTFLGASVCGYQSSIGWGTQSSSLNVTLVEDVTNSDVFTPVLVGQPVYFTHSSFSFGGILQSWRQKHGETSNPIYEVEVTDPREILSGVQLILRDYYGDVTAVPNLYNLYKKLIDDGYYGSNYLNDTGMVWGYIDTAMGNLLLTKPISFRGYNYTVVFNTPLPLSAYYRIGGQNISLLDYIDEVCNASGHDYYITLEAGEIITIHTINRNIVPVFGAIEAFISSVGEVNAKEYGRELRNETNAKFLVGGQKEEFAWYSYTTDEGSGYPYNYNIWPYWGLDLSENIVIGSGLGNNHRITLDTSSLEDSIIGETYVTDTAELKAAGVDQDTWAVFLAGKDTDPTSIHYGKFSAFGMSTSFEKLQAVIDEKATPEKLKATKLSELVPMIDVTTESIKYDPNNIKHKRINQFYNWYSNYYSEYYGKKFMVRTTSNTCVYESDTNRIVTEYDPVDSAFVESSVWPTAVANHYLPAGVSKFLTDDNKISCFVRFPNPTDVYTYDLSEFSDDDYINYDGYLFIKASVEPNLVFANHSTLTDPRAVVTLPGRLKPKSGSSSSAQMGGLEDALGGVLPTGDLPAFISRAGADAFYFGRHGSSYIPNFVALPLRSNIATYGPWYALSADGKVEYERDETLVPWNYGGYTQMDYVGWAKVNTNISYEQANEGGVIVVPGEPGKTLGEQIIAQSGYPYITDVNVSVGADGVMTTYHLQQWTPRFGTTSKQEIDNFKKHSLLIQQERKKSLILNRYKKGRVGAAQKNRKILLDGISEHRRSTSSPLIMSEVIPVSSGVSGHSNLSFSEVVITPYKNVAMTLEENYTLKALSSLDAIFRPFDLSTSGYLHTATLGCSGVFIPRIEVPTSGASSPTITDLNPFGEPHDMSMFIMGGTVPTEGLAIDYTGIGANSQYRPIGLRAPLMLVGYGYDTAGTPVPSGGDGQFIENYKRRQDLWKVGPLDTRWDDARKVWSASGDSILTAKVTGSIVAPGSANGVIFQPGGSGTGYLMSGSTYTTQGTAISIYDPLYNLCALSGEYVNIISKNGRYEPVGEFGFFRHGTCHNDVNPDQYGSVSVTNGTVTGTVTAYDKIMEVGQIISSGSLVYINFDKTDRKFYIVESACSGSLP